MKKYKYELELTEAEESIADRKATALSKLPKKLSVDELEKLAHIVEHDPGKLAQARAFLKLYK